MIGRTSIAVSTLLALTAIASGVSIQEQKQYGQVNVKRSGIPSSMPRCRKVTKSSTTAATYSQTSSVDTSTTGSIDSTFTSTYTSTVVTTTVSDSSTSGEETTSSVSSTVSETATSDVSTSTESQTTSTTSSEESPSTTTVTTTSVSSGDTASTSTSTSSGSATTTTNSAQPTVGQPFSIQISVQVPIGKRAGTAVGFVGREAVLVDDASLAFAFAITDAGELIRFADGLPVGVMELGVGESVKYFQKDDTSIVTTTGWQVGADGLTYPGASFCVDGSNILRMIGDVAPAGCSLAVMQPDTNAESFNVVLGSTSTTTATTTTTDSNTSQTSTPPFSTEESTFSSSAASTTSSDASTVTSQPSPTTTSDSGSLTVSSDSSTTSSTDQSTSADSSSVTSGTASTTTSSTTTSGVPCSVSGSVPSPQVSPFSIGAVPDAATCLANCQSRPQCQFVAVLGGTNCELYDADPEQLQWIPDPSSQRVFSGKACSTGSTTTQPSSTDQSTSVDSSSITLGTASTKIPTTTTSTTTSTTSSGVPCSVSGSVPSPQVSPFTTGAVPDAATCLAICQSRPQCQFVAVLGGTNCELYDADPEQLQWIPDPSSQRVFSGKACSIGSTTTQPSTGTTSFTSTLSSTATSTAQDLSIVQTITSPQPQPTGPCHDGGQYSAVYVLSNGDGYGVCNGDCRDAGDIIPDGAFVINDSDEDAWCAVKCSETPDCKFGEVAKFGAGEGPVVCNGAACRICYLKSSFGELANCGDSFDAYYNLAFNPEDGSSPTSTTSSDQSTSTTASSTITSTAPTLSIVRTITSPQPVPTGPCHDDEQYSAMYVLSNGDGYGLCSGDCRSGGDLPDGAFVMKDSDEDTWCAIKCSETPDCKFGEVGHFGPGGGPGICNGAACRMCYLKESFGQQFGCTGVFDAYYNLGFNPEDGSPTSVVLPEPATTTTTMTSTASATTTVAVDPASCTSVSDGASGTAYSQFYAGSGYQMYDGPFNNDPNNPVYSTAYREDDTWTPCRIIQDCAAAAAEKSYRTFEVWTDGSGEWSCLAFIGATNNPGYFFFPRPSLTQVYGYVDSTYTAAVEPVVPDQCNTVGDVVTNVYGTEYQNFYSGSGAMIPRSVYDPTGMNGGGGTWYEASEWTMCAAIFECADVAQKSGFNTFQFYKEKSDNSKWQCLLFGPLLQDPSLFKPKATIGEMYGFYLKNGQSTPTTTMTSSTTSVSTISSTTTSVAPAASCTSVGDMISVEGGTFQNFYSGSSATIPRPVYDTDYDHHPPKATWYDPAKVSVCDAMKDCATITRSEGYNTIQFFMKNGRWQCQLSWALLQDPNLFTADSTVQEIYGYYFAPAVSTTTTTLMTVTTTTAATETTTTPATSSPTTVCPNGSPYIQTVDEPTDRIFGFCQDASFDVSVQPSEVAFVADSGDCVDECGIRDTCVASTFNDGSCFIFTTLHELVAMPGFVAIVQIQPTVPPASITTTASTSTTTTPATSSPTTLCPNGSPYLQTVDEPTDRVFGFCQDASFDVSNQPSEVAFVADSGDCVDECGIRDTCVASVFEGGSCYIFTTLSELISRPGFVAIVQLQPVVPSTTTCSATPRSTYILEDRDFEFGQGTRWTLAGISGSVPLQLVDDSADTPAHSGCKSAKIEPPADRTPLVLSQGTNNLQGDQWEYTFSFWVRLDQGNPSCTISVTLPHLATGYTDGSFPLQESNNEWQQISWSAVVTQDWSSPFQIAIQSSGVVYIDDFDVTWVQSPQSMADFIKDGGFEDGPSDQYWSNDGVNGVFGIIPSTDTDVAHSGNFLAYAHPFDPLVDFYITQQVTGLKVGGYYLLTGWYRRVTPDTSCTLMVESGTGGASGTILSPGFDGDDVSWKQLTFPVWAQTSTMAVTYYLTECHGALYFDDVSLTEQRSG